MGIKCIICENQICKYAQDFNSCGGRWAKNKPICDGCAKEIAKQAKEWEAPNWAYPLDDGRFYKASTATTLCLCRTSEHVFPSVRTNAPYLARHIPWYYTDLKDLPEDEVYYMKTVYGKKWNYWSSRVADALGVK